MNVTIIQHYGGIGGSTNSCFDVAHMLIKLGHQVKIAVSTPSDAFCQSCKDNNIRFEKIIPIVQWNYHMASGELLRSIIKSLLSYRYYSWWKNFFANLKSDVIIFNSSVESPLIHIAKQYNVTTICFIRETFRKSQKSAGNRISKHFISCADYVTYLTNYDKLSWKITGKKDTLIIPDIVDEARYSRNIDKAATRSLYNITSEDICFIYLGGLSIYKGALDLITAFNTLHADNTKLIILGETYSDLLKYKGMRKVIYLKHIKYLKNCIREISSNNNIIQVGIVNNVSNYYQISDVVVFPVNTVHQARPAYEAGFYSLPIIMPDFDNFGEVVDNNINGLLYEKGNINSLIDVMQIALNRQNDVLLGKNNCERYKLQHSFQYALQVMNKLMSNISKRQ